jgi:hypothetical protein
VLTGTDGPQSKTTRGPAGTGNPGAAWKTEPTIGEKTSLARSWTKTVQRFAGQGKTERQRPGHQALCLNHEQGRTGNKIDQENRRQKRKSKILCRDPGGTQTKQSGGRSYHTRPDRGKHKTTNSWTCCRPEPTGENKQQNSRAGKSKSLDTRIKTQHVRVDKSSAEQGLTPNSKTGLRSSST